MTGKTEIRLDMLESDGITAGWIVCRACNVYQAFKQPAANDDQVVDLMCGGELVGIYPNLEDARDAVLDSLGITEPQLVLEEGPTLRVLK